VATKRLSDRVRRLAIGLMLAGCLVSPSRGEPYPDHPIRLIAPFPAGGLADVLARAVGDELAKSLGQPVIVENRAGAGGNVGADFVAKSAPDGYTLMMASAGILTANQFLYAQMPFDPVTAFAPVTVVADMPMVLVVHPKVAARSLQELVALARAEPGKLNFGSPGTGTTGHLGLAMFMRVAGVKVTHVPYRGAAPAIQDLIAGQIDGVVDNPPTVIAHIQAGRLRPLAVAAARRMALLPDLPTAAEAGLPGYEAASWFGIVAPAGTPEAILRRLHGEIVRALRVPATQERFANTGARLVGNSADAFAAQIRGERASWGEIIRAAKISAE
jgi:tripartite-type tricarboxylate transporter receptor subunit TctC